MTLPVPSQYLTRTLSLQFCLLLVSQSTPEVSGGEAAADSAVLSDDVKYSGVFGQNFLWQQGVFIRLLQ